jgi:hypothetical protein
MSADRKRELARLRQQRRRQRLRDNNPVTHPVTHVTHVTHPVTHPSVTQEPTVTMTKVRYDELLEEIAVLKLRVARLETETVTRPVTQEPVTPVTQRAAGPVPSGVGFDKLTSDKIRARKLFKLIDNPNETEGFRKSAHARLVALAEKQGLTVEQLSAQVA